MIGYYKNLNLEDIDGEIWKDIPGYEGSYQVSTMGRVKSIMRTYINSNGHTRTIRSRILCQVINKSGYPVTAIASYHKRKTFTIHRLVTRAFIGENPLDVDHINGIKTDNRLENLEYVTTRENSQRYYLGRRGLPLGVSMQGIKYSAAITIGRTRYNLGTFISAEEASIAYNIAVGDPNNIDKYKSVKAKNPYGNGISLVQNKFMVRFMRNRKWVYLGRFSSLEEAQKVSSKYLNPILCH